MIGLLGEGNISYFSAEHSEIIYFYEKLKESFENMIILKRGEGL